MHRQFKHRIAESRFGDVVACGQHEAGAVGVAIARYLHAHRTPESIGVVAQHPEPGLAGHRSVLTHQSAELQFAGVQHDLVVQHPLRRHLDALLAGDRAVAHLYQVLPRMQAEDRLGLRAAGRHDRVTWLAEHGRLFTHYRETGAREQGGSILQDTGQTHVAMAHRIHRLARRELRYRRRGRGWRIHSPYGLLCEQGAAEQCKGQDDYQSQVHADLLEQQRSPGRPHPACCGRVGFRWFVGGHMPPVIRRLTFRRRCACT